MRDPHVQRLHYEVSSGEGISYRDPKPVTFSHHLGDFELRDGRLSIALVEHFASEDDARQEIDPFLQAWRIEADLTSNVGMIRFKFDRADVIDRDPPPPGAPQVVRVKPAMLRWVGCKVSPHLTCLEYPQPPTTFRTTSDVECAYSRWMRFRAGKESLQVMAYYVLTILETGAGGRRQAADAFEIDHAVLEQVGRLSTVKGDRSSARKAPKDGEYQDLADSEKHWLDEAVRKLIHRLGERASGACLTRIRLTDLPTL